MPRKRLGGYRLDGPLWEAACRRTDPDHHTQTLLCPVFDNGVLTASPMEGLATKRIGQSDAESTFLNLKQAESDLA